MTLDERQEILKKISRTLSIMMCEMKLNQSMNIFSLNIHAEDFYRNVFNFLYVNKKFINANSAGSNEPYIDLVCNKTKHVIQITTTTGKEKIDNTLKVFEQEDKSYLQYELDIFFLLEKPKKLMPKSIQEYNEKYGIEDIRDNLKDHTDLINDIKNLDDVRLKAIYDEFFKDLNEKYTDEIAIQIVFESLVKDNHSEKIDYSEDFNNIELEEKIDINNVNRKVSACLLGGNEASLPIYETIEDTILTELKELIVNDFYSKILKEALRVAGATPKDVARKSTIELHKLASTIYKERLNFSKILGDLCHRIKSETFNANYQETSMAWIIIAYFFEECDIGIKE